MSFLTRFWLYFAGSAHVPEWAGLKNDLGHTATAATLAYLLLLIGVGPFWATCCGALGLAVVQEVADRLRYGRWSWDMVSDAVSYQFLWPVYLVGTGAPWWALTVFLVVAALYVWAVLRKLGV